MMAEQIFTNARLVLADEVVEGTLAVRDGVITAIDRDHSRHGSAIDLEGDYLMPGFVELHTDNLEKHMTPRPKAEWPPVSAAPLHMSSGYRI